MQRRLFLISALAGSLAWWMATSAASAAERKVFDAASFEAAQQRGARILVDISATWCPTCKAQHKVLDSLAQQPEFADIVVFEVDFDSQKDAVKSFNARQQSTLIAFNGAQETRRLVGETGTESIEGLLKSTLKK